MDDLHGDRAQEQALNTTETSRSHHDVLNVFLASYLSDGFCRLSTSDKGLKTAPAASNFPIASLRALADACDALSCQSSSPALCVGPAS